MSLFCLPILLTAIGADPAASEQPTNDNLSGRPIHQVVERGLAYLQVEGAAWMNQTQCVSCHHIPLMVWALSEARNGGYHVDEKLLGEVTSWALSAQNHAQIFPDLPLDKKRTETDYLGPLFMALSIGTIKERDSSVETARQRLLTHAVGQQDDDGSWDANRGGRPPTHASRDVQTAWLLLALSGSAKPDGEIEPWKAERALAVDWLSRNPTADSHQALAMRLLVYQRLGKPSDEVRPLVRSLLDRQKDDGGWSQSKTMESDAFATGLSLYVLSEQPAKDAEPFVARASAFLSRTQQPDGSWQMSSRRAEPTGPGPAGDLRPIRYIGTAWATIGLVRSYPADSEK